MSAASTPRGCPLILPRNLRSKVYPQLHCKVQRFTLARIGILLVSVVCYKTDKISITTLLCISVPLTLLILAVLCVEYFFEL